MTRNPRSPKQKKRKKNPVGYKISKLMAEGFPHKQAVAIALRYNAKGMLGPRGGVIRAKKSNKSKTK